MPTTQTGAHYAQGDFVQDGRAEAQITDISPDRMMVTIEYTDTRETMVIQANRIVEQTGELRVA